jgi:hypothetical protein
MRETENTNLAPAITITEADYQSWCAEWDKAEADAQHIKDVRAAKIANL